MKIFHSVFPPSYPQKKVHPNTIKNLDKWVSLSSDVPLERTVVDYHEALVFIQQNFDSELATMFYNQPEGRFKSDIWRLCVLWVYGGIYCDIDQEILQPFISQLNITSLDFVGCSNSDLTNLSNGFLYAKKHNKIIKLNIDLLKSQYKKIKTKSDWHDHSFVGGCPAAGKVIEQLTGNPIMPLGFQQIDGMKCFFLHEKGDETLDTPTTKQKFWNSFKVYNPDTNEAVMNSRYSTYFMDRNSPHIFQPVN